MTRHLKKLGTALVVVAPALLAVVLVTGILVPH